MGSVGAYLRTLRTRRGVSLEEIARATRVAPRYLESLEADAYDRLPAPVFIRGFIRAYCQALGEAPEEALACYEGREGPAVAARPAPVPRISESEPRSRSAVMVSLVLVVVLGMALFTVALVLQPQDRASVSDMNPAPAPTIEPAAPEPGPSAEPSPPPRIVPAPERPSTPPAAAATRPVPPVTPVPPAPTVPDAGRAPVPPSAPATPAVPSPPAPVEQVAPPGGPATVPGLEAAAVSAPYRLTARIIDPTWIRVRTEDGRSSEETIAAGEVREWVSDRPFVVTIGNAGGVVLELNGRVLPPLGARGVVIPRLVLPPERH